MKSAYRWVAFYAAVFLTVSSVTACTSLSNFLNSPTGQETIQAVVDVAVAAAEKKGVAAVEINSIAKQALAADQGTTATLSAIDTLVNERISQLPSLDQAAATILETALTAAVVAKVGNNPNVAQAQASAAEVLQAVIAATGG